MLRYRPKPSAPAAPTGGVSAPAPDDKPERRLIARVAAGDVGAFEVLYRSFHPRLARFLQRMTQRSGLVEEVLNDTLLFVWTCADRYDGSSQVSTWIFGVAYRKALHALRRFDESLSDSDRAAEAQADEAPGPEERADAVRRLVQLQVALRALSPEHRAVVELAYFHDMAYRDIATIADCPVDTVKTRMFHARRRLRALLPGVREDWL